MIRKKHLTDLKVFENNNPLDLYLSIVRKNKNTNIIKNKTQSHHFIPVCYYKSLIKDDSLNSKEKDKLAMKMADSDPNNFKVNLLYKDHILVHYYLCLCTKGNLQYRLANAFFHLTKRKWKYTDFNPETGLEEYQKIYEIWKENMDKEKLAQEMRKRMTGKQWRKGYKDTEEHKKAIGNANRHPRSEETKLKISKTWKIKAAKEGSNIKGKNWSLESKKRQSELYKGRKITWDLKRKNQ